MAGVKISSTGYHLPPKVQTSAELAPLLGVTEEWIINSTGITERRIAGESMDACAAKAARDAIGSGAPPDCIINASTTPLQLIPDSSVFIQRALGYEGIPSWSVHATCLSFLVAMNNAAALIKSGVYKRILIVSAETGTPWRNFNEPESAALFGDAAAAAIMEPAAEGESSDWLDWEMATWNEGAELTEFRGGGTKHPPNHPILTKPEDNLFTMQGSKVYRFALRKAKNSLEALLARNNLAPGDIDWIIPHQASGHAVEAATLFGFRPGSIANIISKYGNCISASIPLALAIYNSEGRIRRGGYCVLGGTGAGLSIAFALIKF